MLANLLDLIENYDVAVVGDAIIDEYCYVKPQGKSPKENIITQKVLRTERFQGGVFAAARHIDDFCGSVEVFHGSERTVKRRFVEETYLQKLFEVHDEESDGSTYPTYFTGYDLVIVTDFGHGFIDSGMVEQLCSESRFLAVNAQTNSANHGFNLITKYPHADYVVIDELEARLAAHDRESPIEVVIEDLGFKRIIVTLGPNGSIGYDGIQFTRVPAVSNKIVDTMGAGDAFFCVTAPLAAAGADMRTLCEVGNAAGAIKCSIVGHRQPVTREALLNQLSVAGDLVECRHG